MIQSREKVQEIFRQAINTNWNENALNRDYNFFENKQKEINQREK